MRIALDSPWPQARGLAIEGLAYRDNYEYVPTLLAQMSAPILSRVNVIPGARGQILYQHVYYQKMMDQDVVKEYDTIYEGLTGGSRGMFERQSESDIRRNVTINESALRNVNVGIAQRNQQVIAVLEGSQGLKLGADPDAWWAWWNESNDVYVAERPVDYDQFSREVQVYDMPIQSSGPQQTGSVGGGGGSCECLVAGTLVWTDRGPLAIETLTVGDRVLSQNIETGELGYRNVLRPTVRPETKTFVIETLRSGQSQQQRETLTASGGHPFWVNGQGWVQAESLQPGMVLACSQGVVLVSDVTPGKPQELYNLVVDGNANYFVGQAKILSHDNTLIRATKKLLPGYEGQ